MRTSLLHRGSQRQVWSESLTALCCSHCAYVQAQGEAVAQIPLLNACARKTEASRGPGGSPGWRAARRPRARCALAALGTGPRPARPRHLPGEGRVQVRARTLAPRPVFLTVASLCGRFSVFPGDEVFPMGAVKVVRRMGGERVRWSTDGAESLGWAGCRQSCAGALLAPLLPEAQSWQHVLTQSPRWAGVSPPSPVPSPV